MSEPNSKLFKDHPAAYYTELGAQIERERIIKLLEEVLKFDSEQEKRNLFALIKGEQK